MSNLTVEYKYVNYAWGFQTNGFTVDVINGNITKYDTINKPPTYVKTLEPEVTQLLAMAVSNILKNNTNDEKKLKHTASDAGTTTITINSDEKKILLNQKGDYTYKNNDDEDVKFLVSKMREIKREIK